MVMVTYEEAIKMVALSSLEHFKTMQKITNEHNARITVLENQVKALIELTHKLTILAELTNKQN